MADLIAKLRGEADIYASYDVITRKLLTEAAAALTTAQAEAEALRAEVERLSYDGIHTCHDGCLRLPCVQRREIERLRGALRACRCAVAGGKAEPRQTVREIVDLAIEEHDRAALSEPMP